MKMFKRLGQTKKEYVAGRENRARSLKAQFSDSEKLPDGRNRYFLKNGIVEGRE